MVVRQKKNSGELFISCISFPNCKNAVWFPTVVKTLHVLPDTCPAVSANKIIRFLLYQYVSTKGLNKGLEFFSTEEQVQ